MLDPKFIKENPKIVIQAMKNRGLNKGASIKKINSLSEDIVQLQQKIQKINEETNKVSKEIAQLSGEDKQKKIAEVKKMQDDFSNLQNLDHKKLVEKRIKFLMQLPNIPREDVKVGKDETENEVLREIGEKPNFDFPFKDYMELGESLDIIDVKRASNVSGSRFGYLKGGAAILEFALVQYVLDTLVQERFNPIIPPTLVKEKVMESMGYLSQAGKEETYLLKQDNLYLVGTSEQSVGAMYMDEVLENLPKRYIAFSSCFRREAGSYGKDTKGILRVHQFDKLEMFIFCKPENSDKEHDLLLSMQERLMQGLKLPYRVVKLCTGDIGYPSARTYDIETWIPSEGKYRETHSTSTCTDYQSRGMNIKYKDENGKIQFVHTLNGTAFAIGRIIIAIIENYQTKEGEIVIPEVLRKYTNLDRISKTN